MQRKASWSRVRVPVALLAAGLGAALMLIPATATAATAKATTASPAYNPVTNYVAYVGNPTVGKANSKLSPVYIGVTNEQGGALDIAPQWTVGQTVGAEFLNQEAGGVDGHPVKLVECFIPDTVSNATTCGQEFANNNNVDIIDAGAIVIGNEALENSILPTKKPITFSVAIGGPDDTYPYGYIFMGDGTHVEAPWATAMQILHVHSVSIVWDEALGTTGIDITIDALKYVGIKQIYSVGYDPSTTDFTPAIQAAHVGHTGFFINDAGGTGCADTWLAMKELGLQNVRTGVNAPCDTTQTAISDGGSLPKNWYYLTANPLNGDAGDPSIPALHKVFEHFGQKQWEADAWSGDSFGQILTTAKFMSEVLQSGKPLSPANLNAVAKAFKGPVAQGAPDLNCHGFPHAPAVCNDRVSFFRNTVPATATSPGVMVPLARWVTPPKGFKIPVSLL